MSKPAVQESVKKDKSSQKALLQQIKVLLIDSKEANYQLTRQWLKQANSGTFSLEWAPGYREGSQAIEQQQHDVYLINSNLEKPDDGLALVKQAVKNNCSAPLIVLTTLDKREIGLKAMNMGATDYLVQDYIEPASIERAIHYALQRKQSELELQANYQQLEQKVTKHAAKLSKANTLLQEKIARLEDLERHMQESLEWRARQVETSTQVAQQIAAAPELDTLFLWVVNLIQERFGYYHVHVYTLDNNHLVMQQGTGDPARMMKQVGHRISLDASKSLIAKAARTGEPVLAPDVTQENRWLPNLLLSETKSEIALPIKLGNKVLGVLDIQHDLVNGLGPEDQILMMGLCGQIAVAINNQQLEIERKQAQEAQQEVIKELDAFGHTVSHNLKDPVNLIIGYTTLLKEHARLPEELEEYLNAMARNGHKLNNIIEELQILSGIRKASVQLAPLNMRRIIAEVQQRLAFLIHEYDAKIIVSGYWPVALGHTPWVEEIWANYMSNAIKYGGKPPRLQLGATAQSDGMIRFWVRDNGPGLTQEEQAQLFTEFTNLNRVSMKGHGLGLSIVHRIVTKLGGEVGVSSEGVPGQGSVFTFTLPRAKQT